MAEDPHHAHPTPTQGQPDMDDRTSDMNPAAVLQLIRRTARLCLQAEEPIYFPAGGGVITLQSVIPLKPTQSCCTKV